jgi:sirohydrochlorin cobaltochelatase
VKTPLDAPGAHDGNPFREAALLLVGHGSTLNADSSAPTWSHAEEIRRRGIFAEVQVTFWKEEPNFREALRQTRRQRVYVVPNFISSGYFTEQIIPRELGLAGARTLIGDQEIIYCAPVGLHPSMTEALLQRAAGVVAGSGEKIEEPARTACLFICGHGTSFNDNSTKIIHEQAAAIRARGLYADCQAVLMEQKPFVRDWRTLTACPDVIVVPFFIADGLHSFEDIPVLLGLTHDVREKSFANPHHEPGRRLWYATSIGTEKSIADVIVAQVEQAEAEFSGPKIPARTETPAPALESVLARWLEETPPPWKMGQVVIQPGFELRQVEDAGREAGDLRRLTTPEELRELVNTDAGGCFRPLRAAPNLRSGWIYRAPDVAGLHLALDAIYPAALANAALFREGRLSTTPWTETAERQSGRFRVVREIEGSALEGLITEVCERGCLKTRLWPPGGETTGPRPGEWPLLCPEACNFLVAKAREKLKGSGEE